jgi:hypothetical protein
MQEKADAHRAEMRANQERSDADRKADKERGNVGRNESLPGNDGQDGRQHRVHAS